MNMQQHSSLLRLPSEIRLSVLRLLLLAEKSLFNKGKHVITKLDPPGSSKRRHSTHRSRRKESWKEHSPIVRHGYGLDSQIICVCQQMWREGWSVLYKENVLGIDIHATKKEANVLTLHGGTQAWIPAYQTNAVLEPRKSKDYWYDSRSNNTGSTPETFCKNFRRCHIKLDVGPVMDFSYEDLREIILKLRSTLSMSCLTLELSHHSERTASRILQHVKLLLLFRAQSLHIQYNGNLAVRRQLTQIADTVAGNSKVCDIPKCFNAVKDDQAVRKFLYSDNMAPKQWASVKMQMLKDAARDFSKETFEKIKDELAAGLADEYARNVDNVIKTKEKQLMQLRRDFIGAKLALGRA